MTPAGPLDRFSHQCRYWNGQLSMDRCSTWPRTWLQTPADAKTSERAHRDRAGAAHLGLRVGCDDSFCVAEPGA